MSKLHITKYCNVFNIALQLFR